MGLMWRLCSTPLKDKHINLKTTCFERERRLFEEDKQWIHLALSLQSDRWVKSPSTANHNWSILYFTKRFNQYSSLHLTDIDRLEVEERESYGDSLDGWRISYPTQAEQASHIHISITYSLLTPNPNPKTHRDIGVNREYVIDIWIWLAWSLTLSGWIPSAVERNHSRAPRQLLKLAEEKFTETETCHMFTILEIDNTIVISVSQMKDKERDLRL